MALRKRKPTSPGRRFQSVSDFSEITKSTPEKTLLAPLPGTGGRNNHGRKTARHRGAGHKQQYRVSTSVGTRTRFRPRWRRSSTTQPQCPHRPVALPRRREALHPRSGPCRGWRHAPVRARRRDPPGQCPPAALHPVGSVIHNVELRPGGGGKLARGAGMSVQLVAKEGMFATLRLPSTEMRRVPIDCRGTLGEVGNSEAELISIGKAGRNRWKGIRPRPAGSP